MSIAKNLKKLREKKGLSQQQLANLTGLTRNQINQYERGQSKPSILSGIKLANYFAIPVEDLIK